MPIEDNYRHLRKEFEKQNKIVLFLGAGINNSNEVKIMWSAIMDKLFCDALIQLARQNELNRELFGIIRNVFGEDSDRCDIFKHELLPANCRKCDDFWEKGKWCGNCSSIMFNNESDICPKIKLESLSRLKNHINEQFPLIIQAWVIKKALGPRYITAMQKFLYSQINKSVLRDAFQDNRKHELNGDNNYQERFVSLYHIARMILLYPQIEAIITYNYDNYIHQAVDILQSDLDHFFNEEERELLAERGLYERPLEIREIYGNSYEKNIDANSLCIYYCHGYIPSPGSSQDIKESSIILTFDEFYKYSKNVYNWQMTTQLTYLTHYTSIFIGSSLSDMTVQRILYYTRENGNNNRIYNLSPLTESSVNTDAGFAEIFRFLYDMKEVFLKEYGVTMLNNEGGYNTAYRTIENMIVDVHRKRKSGKPQPND